MPLLVNTGGQLAAWLRIRYPDVIAGAISSCPTFFGAPGLGLVSFLFTPTLVAVPSTVPAVVRTGFELSRYRLTVCVYKV